MKNRIITATLVACMTFSTNAGSATPDSGLPQVAPEKVGMSAERLARIKPAMQKYIDQQLVAGTVTIVARNGKVVHFESQGYSDAENKVPMRKDALFRIASMTKPITSVALMMLWEEGKFQLSDPVEKFLPEFKNQKVNSNGDASNRTGQAPRHHSRDADPYGGAGQFISWQYCLRGRSNRRAGRRHNRVVDQAHCRLAAELSTR
jgi:CubicO group peptidase (beta-lactamase class C family)